MPNDIEAQKVIELTRIATALESISASLLTLIKDGKLQADITGSRINIKQEV